MKDEQIHTPGPWVVKRRETSLVVRAQARSHASVAIIARKNRANANLIAAAPDLLSALRVLLNTSECSCEGECVADCTHVIARAAIAKAEGR